MPRKINVIFIDGLVGPVPSSLLKELIDLGQIVAFQRSEGWACLGQAPTRKRLRPIKELGQRAYDIYLSD